MGFLDSLLGGRDSPAPETPKSSGDVFAFSVTFSPVRLTAMQGGKINMIVRLTNISNEEQMASVDVLLSRAALIGFEPAAINKHTEKKLGKIQPGASMEVAIPIYSTNQTKAGNYPFKVVAYAHYLDYDKVMSQKDKKGEIRVV